MWGLSYANPHLSVLEGEWRNLIDLELNECLWFSVKRGQGIGHTLTTIQEEWC